jgi:hypothetical protein
MLNRLLECKGTVIDVFTQQGWHCLQNSQWLIAEQLANMLQPFADHANILQSDSFSLSGFRLYTSSEKISSKYRA